MAQRFVDLAFVTPVTDDYQLFVINPDATDTLRATVGDIRAGVVSGSGSLPIKTVIFGDEFKNELGADPPVNIQTGAAYGYFVGEQQPGSAINRKAIATFSHSAGSYNCKVIYGKRNYGGIADLVIDEVSFGTVDFYNSSSVEYSVANIPITILEDGLHTLEFRMSSKVTASTGYAFRISKVLIQ